MKLTIERVSQILKVPAETVLRSLEEAGIHPDEDLMLGEDDIRKLRPVLFRHYQSSRIPSPEEYAGAILRGRTKDRTDKVAGMKERPDDSAPEETPEEVPAKVPDETPAQVPEEVPDEKIPAEIPEEVPAGGFDPFLEELVMNHVLMVDTCSLMYEGCEKFIEDICPVLKAHKKKLVVPNRVIEELKKHYGSGKDRDKAAFAAKGLLLCKKLKHEDCLTVRGGQYDNFADNVFFVQFSKLRFQYNMVLITQDYHLSQDILSLNAMETGSGRPVRVFRITRRGSLSETII